MWIGTENGRCYMDFLESSAVLVPALTGMALTLYNGDRNTLKWFEHEYCFSPQLQKSYTAQGLEMFFQAGTEKLIYHLEESMGTHLIAFKICEQWVLLEPYVEEGWKEREARLLLAKLNASEAILPMYKAYRCKLPIIRQELAIKTAFVVAENLDSGIRPVESLFWEPEDKGSGLAFSEIYANAEEVNRRYEVEDRFIEAVSQGNGGKAYRAWKDMDKVKSGLRFMSDNVQDQLVGAAIVRTLIRIGAKLGGLSPVLIDSVSQEYAQRMKHSRSEMEMNDLTAEMIGRICDEVRERRRFGWSPIVQRAADYMEINLSKPMTTEEIARAAGEKKRIFASRFFRETGMTVKEYLAKRRCHIAAQLLVRSDAGIQEIATYVGYLDNNYFSKVFRTNVGMSPQAYRNLYKTPPIG